MYVSFVVYYFLDTIEENHKLKTYHSKNASAWLN